MQKFAALIAYQGTDFCGWQKQRGSAADGAPSLQETFEQALGTISQEKVSVVGSGRTDSGVHAVGQVAHFILKRREWNPEILRNGLNSQLPPAIRVQAVRAVPIEFHAQRSAVSKRYSYYFQQGPCALPHLEPFSWWIRRPLDLAAMRTALANLHGQHDFRPFQASGAKPMRTTVREILEAEIVREPIALPQLAATVAGSSDLCLVRMRLVGTGFLKQMVRGIAGTILQVGEGRRSPDCTKEILISGDRALVGPTAPARALWLERVWYPELDFESPASP